MPGHQCFERQISESEQAGLALAGRPGLTNHLYFADFLTTPGPFQGELLGRKSVGSSYFRWCFFCVRCGGGRFFCGFL
ncbi:MAG TPA: hypothetical protein VF783_19510, partial [Terriglobales bacterium]